MKIEATEISKYYREGETSAKGLDMVSLTLEEGEFVLLSGPSGCGKSTLAKCLSLNLKCDEGELSFFGHDEFMMEEKEKRKLLSSKLAYIGEGTFIDSCSALDNVVFPLLSSGFKMKEAKKMAKEALSAVGMDKARKKMGKLSGGERDRVMVARAISSPHPFIFLDEPLANLDGKSRQNMLIVLKKASQGKMFLLISHLPEEVLPYASRHIVMGEGKIVSDEIIAKPSHMEKEEEEKKGNSSGLLVSLKLMFSRPRRMLFSFLISFALSAFLPFIAYSAAYSVNNGLVAESYSYDFANYFPNRLVVEGKEEGEIPSSSYSDEGDLFSRLSLEVYSGSERLFNTISLQPIMPERELACGKEGQEGFYILYDDSKSNVSDLDMRYYAGKVGRSYSLQLNNAKDDYIVAKATFRGVFLANDDDFLSGYAYRLCASPSVLKEIREAMVSLLDEEIASTLSYYSTGPFSSAGQKLMVGEKYLSSLSPEDLSSMKNAYFALYGEELASGKIYLPESLQGKEFSFSYRGNTVSSSSVSDYLHYVSTLSDGEWAVDNGTAKKIAMELGIEKSIYFASRADMDSFKKANEDGLIMVETAKARAVVTDLGLMMPIVVSILFIVAFFFVFLCRFLLTRGYRGKEEDRNILRLMGQSLLVLTLGEALMTLLFFLLGSGLSFALYLLLVPRAARWIHRGAIFFAIAWLSGLLILPLPRFREERK